VRDRAEKGASGLLETRQLRYFLAVAEDLHFARAAGRLHVAQSALSAQIQALERTLGVRLLNRGKRAAVTLTTAGELFRPEAEAALRQMERAEQTGRLAARGEAGHIALGYVGSAVTSGLLADLLRRFHDTHPRVRLSIAAMETPRQLAALTGGLLDIGLIRPRPAYPDSVKSAILQRETLMIALPDNHALAQKASLKAADLRAEHFIMPQFNESAGFADHVRALAALGRFTPEPPTQVNDFLAAITMAAAGYGIVLAPMSFRTFAPANVVFKSVEKFNETAALALAWRDRPASPAVEAFLAAARRSFPATSSDGHDRLVSNSILSLKPHKQ
jgi:DNA-binding transcriptional LysR family regulator